MAKQALRNWLFVLFVLVVLQLTDLIPIPKDPFWYRYLFHTFIDSTAFGAIVGFIFFSRGKFELYTKIILTLQFASICSHFCGLLTELLYFVHTYEAFAILNDGYSPVLRAILGLKITVLGAAGYGHWRGHRRGNRRWNYNPAIAYSDRWVASGKTTKDESGLY